MTCLLSEERNNSSKMADDIDIEEHDILENLDIKKMFPDIFRVKQELDHFEQGALDRDQECHDIAGLACVEPLSTDECDEEFDSNTMATVIQFEEINISNETSSGGNNDTSTTTIKFFDTLDRLSGTKSNDKLLDFDQFEILTSLTKGKVILQDVKSYLQGNENFCIDCSILFSNKKSLVDHINNHHFYHSTAATLLKLINAPKTILPENECDMQVHNKAIVPENQKLFFQCEICTVYLTSSLGYVAHMRYKHNVVKNPNLLQKVNFEPKCRFCSKNYKGLKAYLSHIYVIHKSIANKKVDDLEANDTFFEDLSASSKKDKNMAAEDVPKQTENGGEESYQRRSEINYSNGAGNIRKMKPVIKPKIKSVLQKRKNLAFREVMFYKCYICGLYYDTEIKYKNHLTVKHNVSKLLKSEKVSFDSRCFHCDKIFTTYRSYITHIFYQHENMINKKTEKSNVRKVNFRQIDFSKNPVVDTLEVSISNNDNILNTVDNGRVDNTGDYLKSEATRRVEMSQNENEDHNNKGTLNNTVQIMIPTSDNFKDHVGENTTTRNGAQPTNSDYVFQKANDNSDPGELGIAEYIDVYETDSNEFTTNKTTYKISTKSSLVKTGINCTNRRRIYRTDSSEKSNDADELYKCHVCGKYLMTIPIYEKHIRVNHKTNERPPVFHLFKFNSICQFCGTCIVNWKSYNKHLYKCHKDFLYKIANGSESSETNCEMSDDSSINVIKRRDNIKTLENNDPLHAEQENADGQRKALSDQKFFKCSVCAAYIGKAQIFIKHMIEMHNVLSPELKMVDFNPTCLFCREDCSSYDLNLYHKHLATKHTAMVTKNNLYNDDKNMFSGQVYRTQEQETTIKSTNTNIIDEEQKYLIPKRLKESETHASSAGVLFRCTKCNIYFLSAETATNHKQHMTILTHWTCSFCHRMFKKNDGLFHEKQHNIFQTFKTYDINSKFQCRVLYKCSKCAIHFTEEHYLRHENCEQDVPNAVYCARCDILVGEYVKESHEWIHVNEHAKQGDFLILEGEFAQMHAVNAADLKNESIYDTQTTSNVTELKNKILQSVEIDNETDYFLSGIMYSCIHCGITLDAYDEVVSHCHEHYVLEDVVKDSFMCDICNLKIDETCRKKHEELHTTNGCRFTVLRFDLTYFTSENSVWIKHVFGQIPQKYSQKILNESIYANECRVKLHVLQDGQPDLTLYRCGSCQTFIDKSNVYKHAENSCFKTRPYPCPSCGVAFISFDACAKHVQIHVKRNLSYKSFRVLTFNDKKDQELNKLLLKRSHYFVLYQCRICCVVVEKSETKQHMCNKQNAVKCEKCDLLFSINDFSLHLKRHEELTEFIKKNLKVILFGDVCRIDENEPEVPPLKEKVYDYTLFRCVVCGTCTRQYVDISRHACVFGKSKITCTKCDLHFNLAELKSHSKAHRLDVDFTRGNMRIISFVPANIIASNEGNGGAANLQCNQANNGILSKELTELTEISVGQFSFSGGETSENNVKSSNNKSVDNYACNCGLNFTENDIVSMVDHVKKCNVKNL